MTGRTISHYQVLELLGSGGMGEVYKARDTRLNRLVAIKVLRADLVASASRKQRFIQEAQAASALNHPNIVTVYDIFEHDGTDCLVMEYIAGKTLDALIPRQGMRLNEALRIAVQVAEGLRKAHSAGIIHRDIKPSNIMVPEDGPVRILDFGLAKLTESAESGGGDETRTQRADTEEGTVMGTVAYMSPEQAEGRKVDARTDIFSFGTLLYEMLTGRLPFAGDSKLSTMSAILKEEPKPLENVPSDLEKIVRRCLRKDRDKRFQHMDDVKVTLEEVREDSDSGRLAVAGPSAVAVTRRWPWIVAWAGMSVLAIAASVLLSHKTPRPPQGPILRQVTFDPGLTTEPSVWTAGNMVAYASDRAGSNLDVWVQNLETGESRRLTTNPADDREPAFSPDGSRIAFRSERDGGGIYVVSSLGGEERRIADGGREPKFSPDGKWIAYYEGIFDFLDPLSDRGAALYVVPAAGGSPRRLAPGLDGISQLVWSPDGNHVIFIGKPLSSSEYDWWVAPADGGAPVRTGAGAVLRSQKLQPRGPNAWNADTIYFPADLGDSRNIWKIRINAKTFAVAGQAERLTSGNGIEEYATISGERLVFANLSENADIWSLPIEPDSATITGEVKRITDELAPNDNCSVDQAGKHVVYRTSRGGVANVVWRDLESGQERVLATARSDQLGPKMSPDGSRVAFLGALIAGPPVINIIPAVGGSVRQLAAGPYLRSWAADGRRLLVSNNEEKATGFLDLETGQANWFLPYQNGGAHLASRTSWDDRWIVFYTIIDNGRSEVWVAPVRKSKVPKEEWIQITDGQYWDTVPSFSPNGKIIYFLSHRDGFRCHWAIHVDGDTKKPVGKPFAVQHYHNPRRSPGYVRPGRIENAVARDKIVFVMTERTGNIWLAELAR